MFIKYLHFFPEKETPDISLAKYILKALIYCRTKEASPKNYELSLLFVMYFIDNVHPSDCQSAKKLGI